MRNRIFLVLSMALIVGGISVAGAQTDSRVKKASEVTPSWTYKGHWYAFVTCNRLQRRLHQVKPDEVRKCVADGGTYIALVPGRMDLKPVEKVAQFAGQEVWITGLQTSSTYGTGPTSDETIEGLYAGGDRPATRFETINVLSMQPTVRDDALSRYAANDAAEVSSRVSDKSQK